MAPPPPPKFKKGTGTPHLAASSQDNFNSQSSSLVAAFDELVRYDKVLSDGISEHKFLSFTEHTLALHKQQSVQATDHVKINAELIKSNQEIHVLEEKLKQARNLLHETTHRARKAEQERDIIMNKFDLMREMLVSDHGNTLNNDTRVKLQRIESSLSNLRNAKQGDGHQHIMDADLSIVQEMDVNSTGSILDVSDLSFDATRDPTMDLEISKTRSGKVFKRKSEDILKSRRSKKSRESSEKVLNISSNRYETKENDNPQYTARKSLEKIAARRAIRKSMEQQKLSVQPFSERNIDDYIVAPTAPPLEAANCWEDAHRTSRSPIKTPSVQRSNSINSRRHLFEQKTAKTGDKCGPCGKRIGFRGTVFKCVDCRAVAHAGCRENVPMPCIGLGSAKHTPGKSNVYGLTDYTPHQPPLVPALIVHCVNELERRGLTEVGLYRVPGSEREVRELKEKFLRGKGCPNLAQIDDIHVLCGCIKDFFRGLRDTLIPAQYWRQFIDATGNNNHIDSESDLIQAISNLPQANRDTLAFIMLHMQRVIDCMDNKMTTDNLAKILAPTLIGYSSKDPEPTAIMGELGVMTRCMEALLHVDADFWSSCVNIMEADENYKDMILSPKTPEMLKRGTFAANFTPGRQSTKKMNRLFKSPFLQ